MKVELDMPIAIGDTIYQVEVQKCACCGCPKVNEVQDGICESKDGICSVYHIKEIVVDSYSPYVRFADDNTVKLFYGYYKTKAEALEAVKKMQGTFTGFFGSAK